MQEIEGISASPGVVIGPAFIFRDPDISVLERFIDDVEIEKARLEKALRQACELRIRME
jgi:phosphoenolpyruvate-protein kinase (PTS system EI component)